MPPKTTAAAAEEKRCVTCNIAGHAWKQCKNTCMLCGGVHHRLPCYAFPERCANLDLERARIDAVVALEKSVDALTRENDAKKIEATRLELAQGIVVNSYGFNRGEYQTSRSPPQQEEDQGSAAPVERSPQGIAALNLFSGVLHEGSRLVRGFEDIVKDYSAYTKNRKQTIRRCLEKQARGEEAMPQDSDLRRALDRWNCWPAHLVVSRILSFVLA
jgi:hypothetical protein